MIVLAIFKQFIAINVGNFFAKTPSKFSQKNLPDIFFIYYFVTQSTFNIKIDGQKARSVG